MFSMFSKIFFIMVGVAALAIHFTTATYAEDAPKSEPSFEAYSFCSDHISYRMFIITMHGKEYAFLKRELSFSKNGASPKICGFDDPKPSKKFRGTPTHGVPKGMTFISLTYS